MASIDDLKTNDAYTGTGMANESDSSVLTIDNPNMVRRSRASAGVAAAGTATPKPKRKIADLSSLPKGKDEIEAAKNVKESIEGEVFEAGGIFDKYVDRKRAEMEEINAMIDEHNAMVAASRGEEVPSDEELEKMEERGEATKNMTEVLYGTKYYDEADKWGRETDKVNTGLNGKSPLEAGMVNNPDIDPEQLGKKSEDKKEENLLGDEDEYIDEVESELALEEEGSMNQVGLQENITAPKFAKEEDSNVMVIDNPNMAKMEPTPIKTPSQPIINDTHVEETPAEEPNALEEATDDGNEAVAEEPAPELEPAPEPKPEKKPEPVKVEVASPAKKEAAAVISETQKAVQDAVKNPPTNPDFSVDPEDEEELDGETGTESNLVEEVDADENMKQFQASVSEKIKPVSKKLNLSSFTVKMTPVSVSSASLQPDNTVAMSWALPNSKQYISMRAFGGREIETLSNLSQASGANQFQQLKNRYKMLYDHITSPKPDTLEAWLKSISFLDNDHLFFAAYGAAYSESNFIPYDCPRCKNTFLSDNFPIHSLYKFKDDEAEARFKKLSSSQDGIEPGLYVSEVVQISDRFALGFREPSIWSMIFEPTLLDQKFINKYRDAISVASYIDNIWLIGDDNSISPIGYKIDKNNTAKTIKSRIITYSKIFDSLTADQYYLILAYMNGINERSGDVTFIKPEVTCPNCGEIIPEMEISAESLLFTRSQLATLSLTSISSDK